MINTLRGGVTEDPQGDLSRIVIPEFVAINNIFILVGLLKVYLNLLRTVYTLEVVDQCLGI